MSDERFYIVWIRVRSKVHAESRDQRGMDERGVGRGENMRGTWGERENETDCFSSRALVSP